MTYIKTIIFAILGCSLFAAGTIHAAVYVPPSLSPGDTYHLVFVSSGTRDSSSGNIADYNTFVQNMAGLNSGLTGTGVGIQYHAIASTQVIDASTNALVSASVFNFNGDKIADNFSDMWDGTLDNAILYDQFAALASFPDMWTGSTANGLYASGFGLGEATPRTGLAITSASQWIDDSIINNSTSYAFYGLSQELTVPAAVPLPASIWLLLSALSALLMMRRNSYLA